MNTKDTNFWTHDAIRAAAHGRWINRPTTTDPDSSAVSIDTRTLSPGDAFVAIEGERFDGHDFIARAATNGASLLIISRTDLTSPDAEDAIRSTPTILVDDTRAALTRLATNYRKHLKGTRVIAVTGSNGKTTTVRLIHAALAASFRRTASPKSFNNDIGLPLTILDAKPTDQYLVCEVGMNAPGEIAPLARTADPDIAVVTSIGHAHIEALGSIDNIAREKASLLTHRRPGGIAIATGDAPPLNPYLKTVPNLITFGEREGNDLRLTAARHLPPTEDSPTHRLTFSLNDRAEFTIPFPGRHNALNAAAAVAVARRLGLADEAIREGLLNATPPPMRFTRHTVAGIDIFNDAYNASPESAEAAVRTFAELAHDHKRRVVVMGDMLELGDHAPAAHLRIAEIILNAVYPLDALITVGPMSLFTADAVSEAAREGRTAARVSVHSDISTEVAHRIAASLQPGDAVLLKGSRKVALDTVATALESVESIIKKP